jgi:xylan 1,4-beta-xylosidase
MAITQGGIFLKTDDVGPLTAECKYLEHSAAHWNTRLEFLVPLEGVVVLMRGPGGEKAALGEGRVALVNEQSMHEMYTRGGAWIFDVSIDTRPLRGYTRGRCFDCVETEAGENSFFRLKRLLALLAKRVFYAAEDPSSLSLYKRGMAYLLASELDARFKTIASASLMRRSDYRLTRFLHYVHKHYRENLSVKEIAGRAHVSEKNFSRFFKDNTGMTFLDFYNSIRFSHAFDELVSTDRMVKDIAVENGFPGADSFASLFRKKSGFNPDEYRKMLRQGALRAAGADDCADLLKAFTESVD